MLPNERLDRRKKVIACQDHHNRPDGEFLILELFVTFTRMLLEGPDPEKISMAKE